METLARPRCSWRYYNRSTRVALAQITATNAMDSCTGEGVTRGVVVARE